MQTLQHPIDSPFGAASTAEDVMAGIDLDGRLAIVTGGYSGIGVVTARALAAAGARVLVPARDPDRAHRALADVDGVQVRALDLMDADTIAAFCASLRRQGTPVDLLVNSAGIMASPLQRDREGHEAQFATNHLGHYRLVCGLWPLLAAAGGARVISVSSRAHQLAGVTFDDIDFERRAYDKWQAYGQSKTANALFAMALDRRGSGHGVRAFSLHPGQILTELGRHLSAEEVAAFDATDERGQPRLDPDKGMKSLAQGAATSLWCATSPLLDGHGGVYCEDCNIAPPSSAAQGRKGVAAWAMDASLAEHLWHVSKAWTGLEIE
jgi:NAD(P)-dependent dehydrogenase (short-subunit alcohol dehydrogenase family)